MPQAHCETFATFNMHSCSLQGDLWWLQIGENHLNYKCLLGNNTLGYRAVNILLQQEICNGLCFLEVEAKFDWKSKL